MRSMIHRPMQASLRLPMLSVALTVALGLAACAGSGRNSDANLRGYGTPGVSTYMPADRTTKVQALLDRCAQVPLANPADTVGLPAACAQLHHTLRNQPGNAVPSPAL